MRNWHRSGYTLLELILVLGIIAVLAAILLPILQEQKDRQKVRSCQLNLRRLSLGIQQYMQDSQDRFPLVAVNDKASGAAPFARPFGWADALYPYTKSVQLLQCSGEGRVANPDATKDGFSDYWYNENLNALPVKLMESPSSNFAIGDYKGNHQQIVMNARFNINKMPRDWVDNDYSPARRHLSNNYLFADGHVASYRTGYHDMSVH